MKMKAKRIFAITLFVLFAFAAFALPSSAESSHPDRMVDEGDLLTDSQESALRSELDRLSVQYNCDIVIVTASSLNGLTSMDYADDYYDYYHYGLGSNNSGILMLFSLKENACQFSTCGDAITMFSDETIDYMCDLIPDYLSDGDYYGAFEKYIEMSDTVIGSYVDGDEIYTPPNRIIDEGDLLTDSQEAALRSELDRLSLQYNCDIVIVTASSLNGLTSMEYADDYFDYNHYGLGSNNSGILMLVCLEERAYWFSTCGDAITMFSDKTIDYMRDLIPDYLTDGDYYGAFEKYIEMSDTVIGSYVNDGKIYTRPRKLSATHVLISIALGVGVAFIIMSIKKSKMKTVRMKQEADSYVRSGSMQLTDCRDTFLYSKVDRTRRETESSSGSSTHTSSSGESHGGGGGSF